MMKKIMYSLMVCIMLTLSSGLLIFAASEDDTVIVNPKPSDPNPEDSYTSEWIDIKRLGAKEGIIMSDKVEVPGSYAAADSLITRQPDTHTGWGAETFTCKKVFTGYLNQWEYDENGELVISKDANGNPIQYPDYTINYYLDKQFSTNNKSDSGQLAEYVGQLTAKYSHLGVKDWKGARGSLSGVDHWNVNQINTKEFLTFSEREFTGSEFISRYCEPTGHEAYFYSNNDILMEGQVQVDLPDPSETKPAPDRNEGAAEGRAYWELRRYDENSASGVYAKSDFNIAGDHYATRSPSHTLKLNGKTVKQKEAITQEVADAAVVKGAALDYEFSYEYTNHYRDIYKCVDSESGYCYKWDFDKRIPDWDFVKTFKLSDSIKIDHSQLDTVKVDTLDGVLVKKWVVGREDKYTPNKESRAYYEQYSRAQGNEFQNNTNLKTQTTLPMTPGKLIYEVELPSDAHKGGSFYPLKKSQSFGTFKATELDESLQTEFANGVQLQQKVLADKGTKGNSRAFKSEFVSDLFLTSHFTGFMSGYPYAAEVKAAIMSNKALPTFEAIVSAGTAKGVADFERVTGETFKDDWVFTEEKADYLKLQRYSIPITPNSKLKPKETYKNRFELFDMGLSDLKFIFDQSFSFDHYLFGSGYDEAWIIEQPESRVPVGPGEFETIKMTFEQLEAIREEAKKRPKEKMHNFRLMDRTFPEKVKEILGIVE